ncbi:hypothetical protein M441DRAFT_441672 [Trichoderma asperellum CBS 433.97]|uniref:Uncharacterized protein n=1 Tax=Trichoderma asperellum (strain ATCC 204424 / CBS 433.97 / NBRC 101777) TaxID=1042311 RepID=A0A2T3Z4C6_TRIA4|nr:hypothetical protein M441DRAFT_441672 [Trichoderma asperellum CBS 433.97]PTB39645.1 hypothetical protein M441DRAFT_441672 [Trichoderma asperellum CBS 433.97]
MEAARRQPHRVCNRFEARPTGQTAQRVPALARRGTQARRPGGGDGYFAGSVTNTPGPMGKGGKGTLMAHSRVDATGHRRRPGAGIPCRAHQSIQSLYRCCTSRVLIIQVPRHIHLWAHVAARWHDPRNHGAMASGSIQANEASRPTWTQEWH